MLERTARRRMTAKRHSAGNPAWFHTGGQSGATALLYWYPASGTAVALMTNLDERAITGELARKIADVAARQ